MFMAQALDATAEGFDPFNKRYVEHSLATILHLIPAFLIVLTGPMQFIRSIRRKHRKLHRVTGYTYLVCGTVSAFSGFYFGVFYPFMGLAGAGFSEAMATLVLTIYALTAIYQAFNHARRKNFTLHREWVMRTWTIMTGIGTERVMLMTLTATTDIDHSVLLGATFWMTLAIQIPLVEFWIKLTRTPGNGARHWKDLDERARAS